MSADGTRGAGRFDHVFGPVLYARVETRKGYPAFAQADVAARVAAELRRTSLRFQVEVLAYCLMPNHAHVLLAGLSASAEPRAALRRWKQLTGHAYRVKTGSTLWREKSAEYLLDDPDALLPAVRYLAASPVLAGLVKEAGQYRWLGASRWAIAGLVQRRAPPPRPAWWPERIIAGCRSGYSLPR